MDYFGDPNASYFASGAAIPAGASGDYRPRLGAGFATPDLNSARANARRSSLAHAALIHAQNQQADSDNALLQSATPDELGNLFGQPRNEREARLQQIVQGDVSAKDRGAQMIPTFWTLQEAQKRLLSNQNANQDILDKQQDYKYAPLKFALQQKGQDLNERQFANQKENQGKQFDFENQKFSAQKNFQQAELDQKDRQFNRSSQQDALKQFSDTLKAVKNGEISADEVIAAIPNLSTGQKELLRAHETAFARDAQEAANYADQMNRTLRDRTPKPTPGGTDWFGRNQADIQPSQARIDAAHQAVIDSVNKNANLRNKIFWDANSGTFMPSIRYNNTRGAATDSGAPYDPVPPAFRYGSTFTGGYQPDVPSGPMPGQFGSQSIAAGPQRVQGADGYLYQVINGQPVRTNLRRR